jgi:hypothetical protein
MVRSEKQLNIDARKEMRDTMTNFINNTKTHCGSQSARSNKDIRVVPNKAIPGFSRLQQLQDGFMNQKQLRDIIDIATKGQHKFD